MYICIMHFSVSILGIQEFVWSDYEMSKKYNEMYNEVVFGCSDVNEYRCTVISNPNALFLKYCIDSSMFYVYIGVLSGVILFSNVCTCILLCIK